MRYNIFPSRHHYIFKLGFKVTDNDMIYPTLLPDVLQFRDVWDIKLSKTFLFWYTAKALILQSKTYLEQEFQSFTYSKFYCFLIYFRFQKWHQLISDANIWIYFHSFKMFDK